MVIRTHGCPISALFKNYSQHIKIYLEYIIRTWYLKETSGFPFKLKNTF